MFVADFSTATTYRPDVCLIEAAPERAYSAVTMQPDREWQHFLDALAEKRIFTQQHITKVRQVWERIRSRVGTRLPIPVTQPSADGALQLYWDVEDKYIEIDVYANGTLHWFYKDRVSGDIDGSDDEPERGVALHILNHLVSLVD